MLALPGTAHVYQGEELGLADGDLPSEARARVPLPWEGGPPGYGFTTGEPWLPTPADYGEQTVARQLEDMTSTLSLYRRAIELRRTHVPDPTVPLEWYGAPPGCLAFRPAGSALVCALNTSDVAVPLPPGEVLLASGDTPSTTCSPRHRGLARLRSRRFRFRPTPAGAASGCGGARPRRSGRPAAATPRWPRPARLVGSPATNPIPESANRQRSGTLTVGPSAALTVSTGWSSSDAGGPSGSGVLPQRPRGPRSVIASISAVGTTSTGAQPDSGGRSPGQKPPAPGSTVADRSTASAVSSAFAGTVTSDGSTRPCTVRVASTSNGVDAHAVTVSAPWLVPARRRADAAGSSRTTRATNAPRSPRSSSVGHAQRGHGAHRARNARSVGSSLRGRPAPRS